MEHASIIATQLFDGHHGSGAAIYAKNNLLNNVLRATPSGLTRDEWLAVLPRSLVAAFVKTDKDLQAAGHLVNLEMFLILMAIELFLSSCGIHVFQAGTSQFVCCQGRTESSGTTVTFLIIDEWVVTVASVGDSRCILESADGSLYHLSADHRFDSNRDEVERVTAWGSKVGKLNVVGGPEVGPLRCWPGGLCLSRSIGDMDVGECIIPVPHVKQVKLSNAGGRIIIASDGVWDDLTFEMALECSRGYPSDIAANRIVNTQTSGPSFRDIFSYLKEATLPRGLRDDTTCIVVDILPPEKLAPSPPAKWQGKTVLNNMFRVDLKNNMFRRKNSDASFKIDREYAEPDVVEEIFEDGSAMLSRRLSTGYALRNMFEPSSCAICQFRLKSGQGISIHANPLQHEKMQGWQGPFLCQSCHEKKKAMED
ncbi:putative protein phosphatase 2C 69 [Triticum urartu]|uniref:protein-serine/threonine phosphatase n=1 Tax=Triticum urartu TaxID=4572 RepID=M8AJI5_TRIUA|nr:putative protein phosphatase 2C 69 [Triticum urartu]